jgi:hypothetical protein
MISSLLLANSEQTTIVGIAVGGAFVVAIIGIIAGTIQKTVINKQREQSRREIAAYVAEGSMTPEDGAKLIAAGRSLADQIKSKLGAS